MHHALANSSWIIFPCRSNNLVSGYYLLYFRRSRSLCDLVPPTLSCYEVVQNLNLFIFFSFATERSVLEVFISGYMLIWEIKIVTIVHHQCFINIMKPKCCSPKYATARFYLADLLWLLLDVNLSTNYRNTCTVNRNHFIIRTLPGFSCSCSISIFIICAISFTGLTVLWSLAGFSCFTWQVYILSHCGLSFYTNFPNINLLFPPFPSISCTLPFAYSLQLLLQLSLKGNLSREFSSKPLLMLPSSQPNYLLWVPLLM